jgi:hypothetical protein
MNSLETIRNQSLSACGFFHISTAASKRKRSKKKETAATVLIFLWMAKPGLDTYKM